MLKVAIVIPFYQRTPGILRRTLDSVMQQRLPAMMTLTIIVVDDGSPVAVEQEVKDIVVTDQMELTIIKQNNGGVSKARNAGLDRVDDSYRYIAFLDSDDMWDAGHLGQGVAALELGSDFYFCDQSREGHHQSHFATCTALQTFDIKYPQNSDLLFCLTTEEAVTATLRDFVCQASTTIFRRSIAPALRFNSKQRNAGEDMLFFLALASKASRVCVSAKQMVHCGSGLNIYYGQLNWNAEGFLRRLIDIRSSHMLIQRTFLLSRDNADWNTSHIAKLQRDIAFHSLRQLVRRKANGLPSFTHWQRKRQISKGGSRLPQCKYYSVYFCVNTNPHKMSNRVTS